MKLRSLITFILVAVLALTSVTIAVGQHAMPQGIEMVICTDVGVQTITLDANGDPAPPAYPCIDCNAAPYAQDLPPCARQPMPPLVAQSSFSSADATVSPSAPLQQTRARGPPFLV